MPNGYCPECDVELNLGKSPRKGQRFTCVRCGATLKLTSLSPIELEWMPDEGQILEDDLPPGFAYRDKPGDY